MKVEELAKELIEIPSYKNIDTGADNFCEKEIAEYIQKYIQKYIKGYNIKKDFIDGKRYNLYVYDKNIFDSKIIFFCHMDTVPAKLNQINNRKLYAKIKKNKVSGLGSVDMKGGIAALLSALKELNYKTSEVSVIFYCDEEYDFAGMKKIINGPKFNSEIAVFCEPTDLVISNGCRGLIEFSAYVKGKTAHSSNPDKGLNSIKIAYESFFDLEDSVKNYNNPDLGRTVCNLAGIKGGLSIKDNSRDSEYKILASGNSVPNLVEILVEIRTADKLLNYKEAEILFKRSIEKNKGRFEIKSIKHDYNAFFVPPIKLKKIENALCDSKLEVKYQDLSNAGYYDAEMFNRKFGIPCISFGPGPVKMSHSEDEFVTIESLYKTTEVYKNIIRNL